MLHKTSSFKQSYVHLAILPLQLYLLFSPSNQYTIIQFVKCGHYLLFFIPLVLPALLDPFSILNDKPITVIKYYYFIQTASKHSSSYACFFFAIECIQIHLSTLSDTNRNSFIEHPPYDYSNTSYFMPILLTTTEFLSAKNGCTVETLTHEQPMNIYGIFVGYPGMGKSSAIQHGCLEQMAEFFRHDNSRVLLDRTKSSGLIRHLSMNESTF